MNRLGRTFARWRVHLVFIAVMTLAVHTSAAPRLVPLATNGRIAVSHEPGIETTARELAGEAAAALQRIAADLVDLPIPQTIHIQVVRDAADLAAIAPRGRSAPPWAIGIAYPDLGIAHVALRRGSQVVDPTATLRHELGHLALGAALGDRAPRWLHEGFAYQHAAEWSWERAETLAGMVWFGGVIPIEELDRSFPAEELPANRAYAESYDFVGYLSRRGRWADTGDDGDRWPFRRFLSGIARGAPPDAAAIKAFGIPLRALFDEWREELTQRYLTAPIGLLGLAVWVLCAFLLTLGWWRMRRSNKRRLAQWEWDERAHEAEEDGEVSHAPPTGRDSDAQAEADHNALPDDPLRFN